MTDAIGTAPANAAGEPVPGATVIDDVRTCLATTLQLGDHVEQFDADTRLLGSLPELDSMAVVTVILGLEEHFGFEVDDDEISADHFETLGSLAVFVEDKLAS